MKEIFEKKCVHRVGMADRQPEQRFCCQSHVTKKLFNFLDFINIFGKIKRLHRVGMEKEHHDVFWSFQVLLYRRYCIFFLNCNL